METHLLRKIPAQPLSPEAFRPFGQVIVASDDHTPFGGADAQLQLQNGIPRFYIMRLHQRGRKFHQITRHQRCTQCLGSLGGKEWLLGVAPPDATALTAWEQIVVFCIPGNCFIKLEVGTWHAGPYFDDSCIDFYNLELSDTNLVDYDTCNLLEHYGVEFEIV
ncbi:ureidoglycolate lyase [Stenomitos frigidus]|uniref:Ureidoglycolate hydrolase n=1 Tax=Stenomitos frigidus ULC18 TaxID=2107698 RepID=A0A2T1E533_9CYAN|nr:ureidoglycolate lyase [Stenomitos frigidus]PSB27840.1 Ureidoglycolate hydrolase [Stenomitos frigidus ULC18]